MDAVCWHDFTPSAPGIVVRPFFVPATWRYPRHTHDCGEIHLLTAGRMMIGDEAHEAGWVQCLSPGQQHEQQAIEACQGWVVLVEAEVLAEFTDRYRAEPGWPFSVAQPRSARVSRADAAALVRGLARLRVDGTRLDRDAVLLNLARALRPHSEPWAGAPPWLAEGAEQFAEGARIDEGVVGLAALCGCSREHLTRTLRRCCRCDARSLVRELRLRLAERRIAGGEPAATAACECGFVSYAHFVVAFRARFGVAPGAWRQQALGR